MKNRAEPSPATREWPQPDAPAEKGPVRLHRANVRTGGQAPPEVEPHAQAGPAPAPAAAVQQDHPIGLPPAAPATDPVKRAPPHCAADPAGTASGPRPNHATAARPWMLAAALSPAPHHRDDPASCAAARDGRAAASVLERLDQSAEDADPATADG